MMRLFRIEFFVSLIAVVAFAAAACSSDSETVPVSDPVEIAPLSSLEDVGSESLPAEPQEYLVPFLVPTVPVSSASSVGLGLSSGLYVSPTSWVTPTPDVGSSDGGDDIVVMTSEGTFYRDVSTERRFTCLHDFETWLVETDWSTARDIHYGMDDFRAKRPDCDEIKFLPVFRVNSLCNDENRVGGVSVPSAFSTGESYNYNVRLVGTTKGAGGGMLIHFDRLPGSNYGGCWYYSSSSEDWYQTVVDSAGIAVSVTPVPSADLIDGSVLVCDAELRSRLEGAEGHLIAADLQSVVEAVSTGVDACSFGWRPEVSESPVIQHCPVFGSYRRTTGEVLVHWSVPPADGASCWLFDPAVGQWEVR